MTNTWPSFKVKKLHEDATIPTRANVRDSGLDLYSRQSLEIAPGGRALVATGISIEVPIPYSGFIMPKSGRAFKEGLTVLNTPGLIDEGYTGELKVLLYNSNSSNYWVMPNIKINRGEKIAQLVFVATGFFDPVIVDELAETDRGEGGFGSTGLTDEPAIAAFDVEEHHVFDEKPAKTFGNLIPSGDPGTPDIH